MVTYEELVRMEIIGPRAAQIRKLLEEKPMNTEEIATKLGVSKASAQFYLRDLARRDPDVARVRIGRKVHYYLKSVLEKVSKR